MNFRIEELKNVAVNEIAAEIELLKKDNLRLRTTLMSALAVANNDECDDHTARSFIALILDKALGGMSDEK